MYRQFLICRKIDSSSLKLKEHRAERNCVATKERIFNIRQAFFSYLFQLFIHIHVININKFIKYTWTSDEFTFWY